MSFDLPPLQSAFIAFAIPRHSQFKIEMQKNANAVLRILYLWCALKSRAFEKKEVCLKCFDRKGSNDKYLNFKVKWFQIEFEWVNKAKKPLCEWIENIWRVLKFDSFPFKKWPCRYLKGVLFCMKAEWIARHIIRGRFLLIKHFLKSTQQESR